MAIKLIKKIYNLLFFSDCKITSRHYFSLILSFIFIGCTPFHPEDRSDLADDLPNEFSIYNSTPETHQPWWEDINDPILSVHINEALSNNFTIHAAWARLAQAKALAKKTGAKLLPSLTGLGEAEISRRDQGLQGDPANVRNYGFGLTASYELDLWGALSSEQEAALYSLKASQEDLNAAAITVSAEIASNWIKLVATRLERKLVIDQIYTNNKYLELIQLRFRQSMASALEIYQQRQVLEETMAILPILEQEEKLLSHNLDILSGKAPGHKIIILSETLPNLPPIPSVGLPSDLLVNRPDIRAAGMRLKAADWQLAVAKANRLPIINLSAAAMFDSDSFNLFFDRWILNLASHLTAPIFDGGALAAEVERTDAVTSELLSIYRQTVIIAVKEVEDALIQESAQLTYINKLKLVFETAKKALKEAEIRYRYGLNDYLNVLNQLYKVQDLERDLLTCQANVILARINLYRALGGRGIKEIIFAENKNMIDMEGSK